MHLRERKEIQEMLRRLIPAALALGALAASGSTALAAIWPEQLADLHRVSVEPWKIEQDRAVWEEYGLEAAERAVYDSPRGKCIATAWRLKDPTSALAVWQWLQPKDLKPSKLEKIAVESPTRLFSLLGNYVLDYDGVLPTQEQVHLNYVVLPRLDQSSLPVFPDFLPSEGRLAGSMRFLIGPASLARFEPRISPAVAAFSLGAEAQLARYRVPEGEIDLAVFNYPTPQISRDRTQEFQKIPGAVVKRSATLVVVTLQPPSADAAERLLAKVNFHATVTWNAGPLKPEPNIGDFLITAFTLVGLLLGFTILAGVGFAGVKLLMRKWSGSTEDDPMVTLHLGDKR